MRSYNCSLFADPDYLAAAFGSLRAGMHLAVSSLNTSWGRISYIASSGHIGLYIYKDVDLSNQFELIQEDTL